MKRRSVSRDETTIVKQRREEKDDESLCKKKDEKFRQRRTSMPSIKVTDDKIGAGK